MLLHFLKHKRNAIKQRGRKKIFTLDSAFLSAAVTSDMWYILSAYSHIITKHPSVTGRGSQKAIGGLTCLREAQQHQVLHVKYRGYIHKLTPEHTHTTILLNLNPYIWQTWDVWKMKGHERNIKIYIQKISVIIKRFAKYIIHSH